MITFSNVTFHQQGKAVIDNVNFAVLPGEFVCIVGNGTGLLLRALLGVEGPKQGLVQVDNVNIFSLPRKFLQLYRRSIGVVTCDDTLLPDRTVSENISFPLEVCRKSWKEREKRTAALLKTLQLESITAHLPDELNVEDRAVVSLARALANEPKILLLEGFLDSLDDGTRTKLIQRLHDIHSAGTTILLCTLGRDIAREVAARTLVIEHGKLVHDSGASKPKMDRGGTQKEIQKASITPLSV